MSKDLIDKQGRMWRWSYIHASYKTMILCLIIYILVFKKTIYLRYGARSWRGGFKSNSFVHFAWFICKEDAHIFSLELNLFKLKFKDDERCMHMHMHISTVVVVFSATVVFTEAPTRCVSVYSCVIIQRRRCLQSRRAFVFQASRPQGHQANHPQFRLWSSCSMAQGVIWQFKQKLPAVLFRPPPVTMH